MNRKTKAQRARDEADREVRKNLTEFTERVRKNLDAIIEREKAKEKKEVKHD